MSTRALRRLKGKQRGQEALDLGDLTLGESPEEQVEAEEEHFNTANASPPAADSSRKGKKNKAQKNFTNIYELVRFKIFDKTWNFLSNSYASFFPTAVYISNI